ncbi:MAG: sulfur carrier protein ThiS [Clostridiaceae bacterium]|nr:sulfur carrier protein ThiS [Bacillota bacterium]NLN52357.1 sulfur carrier protein ThiS [Clostridiaceae bacterium]
MITYNGTQLIEYTKALADFLEEHNYNLKHIAVELNGKIVKRADYARTKLQDGDVLEIVTFVGGG